MAIKKLKQQESNDTRFLIHPKNALLLLEIDGSYTCLYMEEEKLDDIQKLRKFEHVTNVKFVGGEGIFNQLELQKFDWPKITRKVIVTKETEAVFYADSGKVRFVSDSEVNEQIPTPAIQGKKKVLIVDDSKSIHKLLKRIISASEKIEVMATALNPQEAKKIIENERPDLITLDIHMPGMNGVEFLKTYLKNTGIPTVMISSVSIKEGPLVLEALANGAVTYIQKPSIDELDTVGADIVEKLEAVSRKKSAQVERRTKSRSNLIFESRRGILAIGSSTGGPPALQSLLTSLPREIPPTVIVQHIPAVFSKALADRMNALCPFEVKEAINGEILKENTVYIAPGGKQFKITQKDRDLISIINDDDPVNRFKPSVDYLFKTVSKLKRVKVVAALLTGMGKDGAEGLLKLKNEGAYTLAQSEETCVVFGMPKEAIALDAQCKVVDLEDIAEEMVVQFNRLHNREAA
jgi:two-component system chemotaxis response regulator CheB